MSIKAVRGAICIKKDKKEFIINSVNELITQLFQNNSLNSDNVVSIVFSVTKDLKSLNPAAALRKNGYASIPLFCTQEPVCKGALKRVIRVLITYNSLEKKSAPVYINGAEKLRPDLAKN